MKAALPWCGTPFVKYASVKGAGVDCVHLVAAILQEVGALPKFEWPKYALDSGVHSRSSALLAWLDSCPSFGRQPTTDIMAGDVICFNLGLSEHHIGLMLDACRFVHTLPMRRVIVSSLAESFYSRKLTVMYRPMESEAA